MKNQGIEVSRSPRSRSWPPTGSPKEHRISPTDPATVKTVRTVGLVDSARGLVPHGHLCWAYQDRAEFLARALEWTLDGIALGQWIEYVGDSSAETLRGELAGLDGIQDALDCGNIGVSSVGDFYRFAGSATSSIRLPRSMPASPPPRRRSPPATAAFVLWSMPRQWRAPRNSARVSPATSISSTGR